MAKLPTSAPAPRSSSGLKPLKLLFPYLAPYRLAITGAGVALLVSGLTVLTIVGGLRYVIDQGFITGNAEKLDQTLARLLIAILVLAAATYGRYWLVTWLGERVIADLRKAVYNHLLSLSPAFYETARSGDILSRLSADTWILQKIGRAHV